MKHQSAPKGKRERTKEKIFKQAISLFLEQGYENTTVQQITEKADVAKGTFFSHFATKDSILTYLGELRLEMMKESIANELAYLSSAKEQILTLFDLLAKANEEDKRMTKLVSYEILKKLYSPEVSPETDNQGELKSIFEMMLIKGQKTGEFKPNFQPSHAADILVGIYFLILLQWLREEESISLRQEYQDRVSIVLGGITVEHG